MPATEKTWRDQAKMHVLFGISALVMLGGTIWMLAKDHNREWRQWQLDDRARERWTFEAQLAQTEANSKSDLERLGKELEAARCAKVDGELVKKFEELVQTEDARLKKDNKSETPADFTKLENAIGKETNNPIRIRDGGLRDFCAASFLARGVDVEEVGGTS